MGLTAQIPVDEDLAYKQAFDLLSSNTEEYNNFIIFLEKEIIPHLTSHEHFLDIGAGRGNLTKPISLCFDRTTIVEPNEYFFDEIMSWSQYRGIDLVGHNDFWEKITLNQAAELIVVSHVLYYVPLTDHLDFLKKAYDALQPGGRIVVALNGMKSDIWKLSRLLYAPADFALLPYAERLFDNIIQWGFPATIHPFESHIRTHSELEMRFLIDFLLLGKVTFDNKAKTYIRDTYLQHYLRQPDHYSIASSGAIIVIYKPSKVE